MDDACGCQTSNAGGRERERRRERAKVACVALVAWLFHRGDPSCGIQSIRSCRQRAWARAERAGGGSVTSCGHGGQEHCPTRRLQRSGRFGVYPFPSRARHPSPTPPPNPGQAAVISVQCPLPRNHASLQSGEDKNESETRAGAEASRGGEVRASRGKKNRAVVAATTAGRRPSMCARHEAER